VSRERMAGAVLEALVSSVDRERFARALEQVVPQAPAAPSSATPPSATASKAADAVLHRIVLSDILDEAILSARPGETIFPLRMFFGALGDALSDDTAFALASGLNFYFRVGMDEEAKMRVGTEVSRLYYRFAEERALERELVAQLSPLLARLMSTELERLRFESVDAAGVFDSSVHERAPGSRATGARVEAPKSFLCRVVSSSMVRAKALVRT
jgi:hypothetical protein